MATTPDPRRVLVATFEGGGNVPPLLGIARRLAARGHAVRVLADARTAAQARAVGLDAVEYRHAPHQAMRDRGADRVRDWEATSPFDLLRRLRDELFFGPADRYARDVMEEADRFAPDLIANDCMLYGAMAGAEATGRPTAVLMHTAYMVPTPGATPLGFGLAPARGPLGRLRDRVVRAAVRHGYNQGLPRFNAVRRELGLPALADVNDQLLAADALLVLTSPTFDFVPTKLPPRTAYVGPQLDDPAWAGDGAWSPPDGGPLVLVAMGSTFQDQGPITAKLIRALAGLPVRALVTTGGQLAAADLAAAPNVEVVDAAPHRAVLPHARLTICHGGHGTTMKSIAAGVPVLAVPLGRDQLDVAARVATAGAGLRVAPGASEAALREAIRRLLEEPAFAAGARRMADALAREAEGGGAVEALERLAGSRGLSARPSVAPPA